MHNMHTTLEYYELVASMHMHTTLVQEYEYELLGQIA